MLKRIGIILFLAMAAHTILYAQGPQEEDTLVIETYYPSPYGYYDQLMVYSRMAIGDLTGDNNTTEDDLAGGADSIDFPGSLVVANTIGIGTTAPTAMLDVRGGVRIGADSAVCDSAKSGLVRYNSADGVMEYCNSLAWTRVNEFTQFQVWDTPGNDYEWTVPAGVSRIMVEMWGAGGGGARGDTTISDWTGGNGGGGGAYAKQIIPVEAGKKLKIMVGAGGSGEGKVDSSLRDGGSSSIYLPSGGYLMAGGGKRGGNADSRWCDDSDYCEGGEVSGSTSLYPSSQGIYVNGGHPPLGDSYVGSSYKSYTSDGGKAGGPGGSGGREYWTAADSWTNRRYTNGIAPGGGGGGAWWNEKRGGDGADGRVIIYG